MIQIQMFNTENTHKTPTRRRIALLDEIRGKKVEFFRSKISF